MIRPNDEGVGASGTNPPKTHNSEQTDYSTEAGNGKAFHTMQARAALCSCTLHELADGYLISRWNYSKSVPCLRAVGDLLRQIGGR